MDFKRYNEREAKQYTAHLCYQLGIVYNIAKLIAEDEPTFTALNKAYKNKDDESYDKAFNLLKQIQGVGPKRAALYLEKYYENPYRSINWEMFNILQKYQKVTGWSDNRLYDLARRIDDPSKIWDTFLYDSSITLPIAIEIYKMTTEDDVYLQNQTIEYFSNFVKLREIQNGQNRLTVPKFNINKELNEKYDVFLEVKDSVMLKNTAVDYVTILKYFNENKDSELIFELNEDIDVSDFGSDQLVAFEKLRRKKTMMLTGFAGTGKTYMLDKYIKNLIGAKVYACALAGKAVKNFVNAMSPDSMRKVTQSTVAGLRYVPKYQSELHDSTIVIVDEVSMVSMSDLAFIIRNLDDEQKLILIGDINQLPAIELDVMNWLVNDGEIELVTLDIPKRQSADSGIFKDSMSIIRKEVPDFNTEDSQVRIGATTVQKIIYENRDADIFLTTTNQVKDIINEVKSNEIRQIPNHAVFKNKLYKQEVEFHEGYQIMIGKNNVDTGLMNGDIFVINYEGHLTDPYTGEIARDLDGKPLKIGENRDYVDAGFGGKSNIIDTTAHNVQMAFAITTHKSQGSTMMKGVTVMGKGPLANRNLLYTALTRFKEKHVLYLPDENLLDTILNTDVKYEKLSKEDQEFLTEIVELEKKKEVDLNGGNDGHEVF